MMPTSGEMYIGDKKITELNLSEYRHNISVVPQNSILFPGSIKENITYGIEKYSKEDLDRAVEMANLNEFLKEFEAELLEAVELISEAKQIAGI